MPKKIAHRELRNNSSSVLRAVEAGETFTVTNHGRTVAVIGPPINEGPPPGLRVTEATNKGSFRDIKGIKIDRPSIEILNELRGER